MESGQATTTSIRQPWQSNSRGLCLPLSAFESCLIDRTGGKPLSAVVVLPVATLRAIDSNNTQLAAYPVFAPVAVDHDRLMDLMNRGMASIETVHHTLSNATTQSATMNARSQQAYQDHYDAGRLARVESWARTETAATPVIRTGPAANATEKRPHRFFF